METAPRRPTEEELLAHREWVRVLARTLAGETALADDLEQETLATALRSPPPRGLGRAWLGTVLRNLHRRSFRSANRSRRREEAAALPEARPGTSDVVARAEAHRRVVEAVLALPEPSRTAILLRFFDGLPPREVARRTRVPVETARTRLKRAIEDLRAWLGGDRGREGLLALLLPLAHSAEETAAKAAGGIAMGTAAKLALVAGAAAALAGGAAAWKTLVGGVESRPAAPQAPPPAVPGTPELVDIEKVPAFPAPAPPPPSPSADAEQRPAEAPAPAPADTLEIEFPEGTTLARALEALGRQRALRVEYESDSLRRYSEGSPIPPFRVKGVSLSDAMSLLLANTRNPEKGRYLAWEVRETNLHLFQKEPPSKEDVAKALRARLREEKTSFAFDGQTVAESLSYLSARHRVNIFVDESARERCQTLVVKLTVREVSLNEALDELLRLDPDLRWEVRGSVVHILGR